MSTLLIQGATVVTPEAIRPETPVLVQDDRIVQVGGPVPSSADEVIDGRGQYLLPGFIDLQVNGYAGADFMNGDPAAVAQVSRALAAHGVTGYLPTLVTTGGERMLKAVAAVAAGVADLGGRGPEVPAGAGTGASAGAVPLGLHIEGPYIAVARHGAHPTGAIRPFDPAEWAAWWEASRGTIRMITLAPEQHQNAQYIPTLRNLGVAVAVGHSDGTYEDVEQAVALGANCATHAFNAMRGLHHRDPGVVGAVMAMDELRVGLIADGHHVHPGAVKALYRAKGAAGIYLVTDAVPVAGLPNGTYDWVGGAVCTDGETVRLATDGSLAGAALTMDRAVANMMRFTGASLSEVSVMASLTPARLMGLQDRGRIASGLRADLVLLSEKLEVNRTLIAGSRP